MKQAFDDPQDVQIAPSLLAADFGRLAEEVGRAEEGGARILHVDVMDGRFVPNISIGIPVVAALRRITKLTLDVHLMIVEPERYVEAFRQAGADAISVHVEASIHLHRTLAQIREAGASAGVAVNPATPLNFLPHVAGLLDYVLIMSVNPGFGGQAFIEESLGRLREARRLLAGAGADDVLVEVDGGIGAENARAAVEAGARLLVCGSSVFRTDDPAAAIRTIGQRARGAA